MTLKEILNTNDRFAVLSGVQLVEVLNCLPRQ